KKFFCSCCLIHKRGKKYGNTIRQLLSRKFDNVFLNLGRSPGSLLFWLTFPFKCMTIQTVVIIKIPKHKICSSSSSYIKLTVAGTATDLHRIPFSSFLNVQLRNHKFKAKVNILDKRSFPRQINLNFTS